MSRCSLYGSGREPLTERHVQALWFDRAMRPDRLYTRAGDAVSVIHPGDWNLGPGPDFKNALLEVGPERRRLRGDVEIHLSPSDWDAHGHGNDEAYSNVVAHVTWGCGPDPASLPPGTVAIWIGRFFASDPGFAPEQIDLAAYPFARLPVDERPCWERLHSAPDLAHSLLADAGVYRLKAKARRFLAILSRRRREREQVFYEEAMAALGYRWNATGFRHIARMVPYAQVAAEPETAAGAMQVAAQFVEWKRLPARPGNRPEARLASAAQLFSGMDVGRIVDATDFSKDECRNMVKTLAGKGLMGKGRAAAVIANVVVPMAVAENRVEAGLEWLPPEDISEPVRLTAHRMFGRDHNPSAWYSTNGLHIQGLLQIYRDYCLQVHPDCSYCRMVASLAAEG